MMVEVDLAGFVGIITLQLLYNFIPDPILIESQLYSDSGHLYYVISFTHVV